MDAPVTAPPVVAVVVTSDPGPWLEEALGALAEQDYPNFSVLVLDAGSAEDPTPRIAAVLPGAFVRRLNANPGFGAAANEVLHVVEGASHLLICHDDVAPDPDAVRLLVEEAFRSNAGIVSPKLVEWDDPTRLLQVGMTADKTGASVPLVERGELDQEQHDGVRDVFVAPSACALVRADLFQSLGGFDPAMTIAGEDVDLCWRAQILGARVVVAPAARVRHLEALARGLRPTPGDRSLEALRARHALRAMRKAYGRWHLARVLPQALFATILHTLVAIVTNHRQDARDAIDAWRWNRAHRREARGPRRELQRARVLDDAEVRRLQARGTAGVSLFARGRHPAGDETPALIEAASRGLASLRVGPVAAAGVVVGAVVLLGTRGLIGGRLSALSELAPFPDSPFTFLRLFASGWRTHGLGADAPAPPAFALFGVTGVFLFGAMGLLQKIAVLGMLPVGLVGITRLARPLGSAASTIAALVVYALIPVPYNALATGRWSGLVAYGITPWLLLAFFRASGREPFGPGAETSLLARVLPVGLLLGVAGAIAPSVLPVTLLVAVGLLAGSAIARQSFGRPFVVAVLAVALGAALLLPWSLELVRPSSEGVGGGAVGALLRFQTGPLGAAPLGWVFLVAAALPILVAGGWRLPWAITVWGGALGGVALAWTVQRGWVPLGVPAPEVALAPAAACLALAVALGVRAFEVDLPGHHFGWRQLASGIAATAVVLGAFPVLGAVFDGRWHQPQQDLGRQLAWMKERRAQGPFRVLWIGRPADLPLHSWDWGRGLSYATSRAGPPLATDLWPGAPAGSSPRLARAVRYATERRTTQLGRLLAPMAVRYVVVTRRGSPGKPGRLPDAVPWLESELSQQVDLGRVETDESLAVYENAAWVPARATLAEGVVPTESSLLAAATAPLEGARAVLPSSSSPAGAAGPVADHSDVVVSEGPSAGWHLDVAGVAVVRHVAFGVANVFSVDQGGTGRLRYVTSPLRYLVMVVQAVGWAVVIGLVIRQRRRRAR